MVQGLAFLSKKSWHTKNLANQEKVWMAEQRKEAEASKTQELAKQIQQEREQEEMDRISGKKTVMDRGIDWMYQGGTSGELAKEDDAKRAEEFLLGKDFVGDGGAAQGDFDDGDQKEGIHNIVSSQAAAAAAATVATARTAESAETDPHQSNPFQEPSVKDRNESFRLRVEDPMFIVSQKQRAKISKHDQTKALYERVVGHPSEQPAKDDDNEGVAGRKKSKKERKRQKKQRSKREENDHDDDGDSHSDRKSRRHRRSRSQSNERRHKRHRSRKEQSRSYSRSRSRTPPSDDGSREDRRRGGENERRRDDRSRRHRDDDHRRHRDDDDKPSRRRDYDKKDDDRRREHRRDERMRDQSPVDDDHMGRSTRRRNDDDDDDERRHDRRRSNDDNRRKYDDHSKHHVNDRSQNDHSHHSRQQEDSRRRDHHQPKRVEAKAIKTEGYGLKGASASSIKSNDLGPNKELLQKKREARDAERRRVRETATSRRRTTGEERAKALHDMQADARRREETMARHASHRKNDEDNDMMAPAKGNASFLDDITKRTHGITGDGTSLSARVAQNRHTNQRNHDSFF